MPVLRWQRDSTRGSCSELSGLLLYLKKLRAVCPASRQTQTLAVKPNAKLTEAPLGPRPGHVALSLPNGIV